MRAALALAAATALATACGGAAVFRLTADENNAYALGQALARREPAAVRAPRAYLVTAAPRQIVAVDLVGGRALWRTDADVTSRIAVGGDFLVAREGTQLVARELERGAPRWRIDLPGELVGVAADRERAYIVYRSGRTWWLAGYAGATGARLWRADAAGALGAPAAQGGLVYVPFLQQWLSIVDGKAGVQLTRLRGIDEQISMVHAAGRPVHYGSKQGVFALDDKSAAGTRAGATYAQLKIPRELERTSYGPDAYDPVEVAYNAGDRARVLWAAIPAEVYAVHHFRYVFGYGPGAELRWAYSHPRVELVASEHTGHAVAAVSASGEVIALDPATGAVRARTAALAPAAQVIGAALDVYGWTPGGEVEPTATTAALVSIVRDRDARFERVKGLALAALAKQPGPEVTRELLGVLADPRASQAVKDGAVELLVERRDPASLPVLVEQLAVRTDYLAGTAPESLGAVARTIAGLGGLAHDPAAVAAAVAALQAHLEAPTTPRPDLVQIIRAMSAIGGGAERAALIQHLLLYHADDGLGADADWQRAIVVAVARGDRPAERDLLRKVASDPRTPGGLVSTIRDTVGP